MGKEDEAHGDPPLTLKNEHMLETYSRWMNMRNNLKGIIPLDENDELDLPHEWYSSQCGGCTFYLPLKDPRFGGDWGVCTNVNSPFDRTVMFEHDSCDFFESTSTGDWVSTFFPKSEWRKNSQPLE